MDDAPAASTSTPSGPLTGYRIVDLTRVVMGPTATTILADQGADVIVVEDPAGDTNRVMGPGPHPQLSGISLNMMRNKRSVSLDLKSVEGAALLTRLIRISDAVLTTMRPGAVERLGLSYEQVRAIRPDIVYCQGQGWPLSSDRADDPAYDDVIQACSGIPELMERTTGTAGLVPSIIADKASGLVMAQAVTAALLHRARTGEGQHVEIAMSEVMKAFVLAEHGAGAISTDAPQPAGYSRILSPERRPHRTLDGLVHVLPYAPKHYAALFEMSPPAQPVDPAMYADRRAAIANSDTLYRAVRSVASGLSSAELLGFCDDHDIPATAVAGLDDLTAALPVAQHPVAGGYHVLPHPARFSRTPSSLYRHAPLVGEHTDQVVAELEDESTTSNLLTGSAAAPPAPVPSTSSQRS